MLIKISEIRENKGRRLAEVAKVKELAESIEQIGLINPITVAETNNQYLLVAGLHRLEAHKILGKDKIEASILTGTDLELELVEIDENLIRNELHYIELDDLMLRKKQIYEEMYPETKKGAKNQHTKVLNEIISDSKPSFSKDTAIKTGQSERNIQLSTQRAENLIPEAKSILREKEITKTEATLLAKEEPTQQKRITKILQDGKVTTIKDAQKEIKKEEKKQELVEKKQEYEERVEQVKKEDNPKRVDIENTDKKFRIIYADPCWSYNDKQNTDKLGGAEKHYDTMSIRELSELPVKEITEDNAVLFLWVTSPLLEESFEVIKAWGFKYKTSFIWDKIKHNMGHYNSVRHEFLLIATKGSCTPDNKKLYDSVQSIERTEHSAKPKEFMDIIDDLYVYGDRLEMFAREGDRENWLYWGNEI